MKKVIYLKTALMFLVMVLFVISGCTTLSEDTEGVRTVTDAGITSFQTNTIVGDAEDVKLGTDYTVILGKEYGDFELGLSFDEGAKPKNVSVKATEVRAFEGQISAHQALVQIREILKQENVEMSEAGLDAIESVLLKALIPVP